MFNERTIRACRPMSYDADAARTKGLADETGFTPEYFRMQAFYYEALMEYADSRAQLRALDIQLADDALQLVPAPSPVNVYQFACAFGMKYLFVMSNVHVENLSDEALSSLSEMCDSGNQPSAPAAQQLVADTIADALREMPGAADDSVVVRTDDGNSAPNVSLVLGLATSMEFDENGSIKDVARENTKAGLLRMMQPDLESQLSDPIGIPVRIFIL